MSIENIKNINEQLKSKTPKEIIEWALSIADKPVITTNFRPYESAILRAVSSIKNDIEVIWCDTGYNTLQTYKHAEELIEKLALNIQLYVPKQTVAYRNNILGLPNIDDPKHSIFTEQVKLEPFRRAMSIHQPDVWFTNLRKGQTAFRNTIDIVSKSNDGVLKVSPFYNWSDEDLDAYLQEYKLPNELNYFDPTKVENNRECGLHS
ncbi:phosphoadenosine phosphosulfate reductase domain-containing protein [Tenacibaculum maritimum]|uniref:phosphoadenosine phosphosulfate reductase domain-containing protein n=1 Tax=Tenacibaculum maritimum TaxID=107401 RepID=UPI0012E6A21C|nr:phosphoadenosine phosphosulfate reductase family protein [Tenacibaculum maritimum]CAA0247636.1 Phosphoadenosine phosphosulfate reductase [Tenacibaculum maritimum]